MKPRYEAQKKQVLQSPYLQFGKFSCIYYVLSAWFSGSAVFISFPLILDQTTCKQAKKAILQTVHQRQ
jgi:hypothetical protein